VKKNENERITSTYLDKQRDRRLRKKTAKTRENQKKEINIGRKK